MVSTVFCWGAQSIKHQIEERPGAQCNLFVHFGVILLTQARKTKKTKKNKKTKKTKKNKMSDPKVPRLLLSWVLQSCSRMRSEGSRFTWGSGGEAVFAKSCVCDRNRRQPSATVGNRLREGRKALHSGECVRSGSESVSN